MHATHSSDDALFTETHYAALDLCTGCIDPSPQELLGDSRLDMLPHATDPPHLSVVPAIVFPLLPQFFPRSQVHRFRGGGHDRCAEAPVRRDTAGVGAGHLQDEAWM